MPYYKFASNEVYINRIRTHPQLKYLIYSGSAYYNNTPDISGSFTGSIRMTSPGDVSLYELNVDRSASITGHSLRGDDFGNNIYVGAVPDSVPGGYFSSGLTAEQCVLNRGVIYPYVIKDGTRIALRTTTSDQFIDYSVGDVISGSYPLTASITKEFYSSSLARFQRSSITNPNPSPPPSILVNYSGSVTQLMAIKNTLNYNAHISPHYLVSSSLRDLTASTATLGGGTAVDVGLLSIPSIMYGSRLKKGTVDLQFYFTGTLIGRAQDTKQNGELIETAGPRTGSTIGMVLYNEGIMVLTGTYVLGSGDAVSVDGYTTDSWMGDDVEDSPRWVYFGQSLSGSVTAQSSSFLLNASGTQYIPTLTMFATAPKGKLNHSNNPSYTTYSQYYPANSGPKGYFENRQIPIKNVVSSSFADPTGSFEKTTYISKIGIYDDNQNLIGIAKVATPIKKTAERDFTFKLKLDL